MFLTILWITLALIVSNIAAQPKTVYSGVTPSNAHWQSEGAGSVSLQIDTRLGLTSTPTYLCRITSRFSSLTSTSTLLLGGEDPFDPLANVTGACTAKNPTAHGFKVRLRYADGVNKNMTVSKAADFRVHWIAVTNKHPGLGDVVTPLEAQAELIKQMINEEPQVVVKGLLGTEYYAMKRNQPKPIPPKPKNSTSTDTGATKNNTSEEKMTE